jgi:DNA-binding CsgD family transcriptional regulator
MNECPFYETCDSRPYYMARQRTRLVEIELGAIGKAVKEAHTAEREALNELRKIQDGATLTKRLREVLELVRQGDANKEIADKIHISVRTVKFHVARLTAMYGVQRRTEL